MLSIKKSEIRPFNDWCKSPPQKPSDSLDISKLLDSNDATSYNRYQNSLDQISGELDEPKSYKSITLDIGIRADSEVDVDTKLLLSGNDDALIYDLQISTIPRTTHQLVLKDLIIWDCRIIDGNAKSKNSVVFENCRIANFNLLWDCKDRLRNTKIGKLSIGNKAHEIDMEGGCVLDIDVTAPGGDTRPLTGSIDFVNTYFPRTRKDYLLTGPQPYRNMRHHLLAIENNQMANMFHALELAVERERDTKINKLLSYAYQGFSNFGSSAGRPLAWWLFFGLFYTLILFFFKGGERAFADASYYSGWKEVFMTEPSSWCSQVAMSLYLSFNTMINPLGLFGYRALLVPSNGWIFIFLLFQGLLSATLIALTILAIPRRFKMQ